MGLNVTIRSVSSPQYTECVCNRKSLLHGDGKTSRLRITIAYATAGLSGRPGKTCNTGNLNGA